MWKQISHNYRAAPFFAAIAPACGAVAACACRVASGAEHGVHSPGLRTDGHPARVSLTSSHPSDMPRSAQNCGSAPLERAQPVSFRAGSFGYMKGDGLFPVQGIEIRFQNYVPKPYPQVGSKGEFVPYFPFWTLVQHRPGSNAGAHRRGTERWLTWDEMLASQHDLSRRRPSHAIRD